MSEVQQSHQLPTPDPVWLHQVRWVVNLIFPLVIASLMLFSAIAPNNVPQALSKPRELLGKRMHKVSLSQTWNMYAPDPPKAHSFMVLYANDGDGTVRKLDDSANADHGWGTVWAWKRTRVDIWQLTVNSRVNEVNRNRVWYLRGVCVREARLGHVVKSLEMHRVSRRIRPPDKVAAGADLLGLNKRKKPAGGDGSCNTAIVREMIAADPFGVGAR